MSNFSDRKLNEFVLLIRERLNMFEIENVLYDFKFMINFGGIGLVIHCDSVGNSYATLKYKLKTSVSFVELETMIQPYYNKHYNDRSISLTTIQSALRWLEEVEHIEFEESILTFSGRGVENNIDKMVYDMLQIFYIFSKKCASYEYLNRYYWNDDKPYFKWLRTRFHRVKRIFVEAIANGKWNLDLIRNEIELCNHYIDIDPGNTDSYISYINTYESLLNDVDSIVLPDSSSTLLKEDFHNTIVLKEVVKDFRI